MTLCQVERSVTPKRQGCLCCGGTSIDPVYLGCRDHYVRTPFIVDYHRCSDCGLLQQYPAPNDVSAFYAAYPVHARKGVLYRALRKWVMSPTYFRPPCGRPIVLLDYGCGDGWYLESLVGRGIELLGYEMDTGHARKLSGRLGIPVLSNRDEMFARHGGAVDVVTMHFVLEHLTDLHGGFEDAQRLLRPGGFFYFVVPQASSLEGRLFGRRWHALDPPRHITFPEPAVVGALAGRHGFKLTDHYAVPFPNGFAGSIPMMLLGRFNSALFALSLPLGIVASRLAPGGARAFILTRR